MEIVFERSPFFQPVTHLLRELERVVFFSHGLLIGSWPMLTYTDHFTLSHGLTTNDIDLAIESTVKVPVTGGETIPELMERLGYTAVHDYSGIETFLHGTFEVEFITHRRGGKSPGFDCHPCMESFCPATPFRRYFVYPTDQGDPIVVLSSTKMAIIVLIIIKLLLFA